MAPTQFNPMDNSAQTSTSFEMNPGIMYKLGSIEAQIKAINDKLDAKEKVQDIDIEALKVEVAKLKQSSHMVLGGAAAISFIIGLIQVVPWQNLF